MRIETCSNLHSVQSIQPKKSNDIGVKGIDNKELSNMLSKEKVEKDKNNGNSKIQEMDEHNLIKLIEEANRSVKTYNRKLEFSIHEATKEIMVKVIDTSEEEDKVIREIPSEKILDMVAKLWEVAGILVDEKA